MAGRGGRGPPGSWSWEEADLAPIAVLNHPTEVLLSHLLMTQAEIGERIYRLIMHRIMYEARKVLKLKHLSRTIWGGG